MTLFHARNPKLNTYIMGIEKEEWNRFIDTGSITRETLVLIANKIKTQKSLSDQEIAIYAVHSKIIELLLTQKFKP